MCQVLFMAVRRRRCSFHSVSMKNSAEFEIMTDVSFIKEHQIYIPIAAFEGESNRKACRPLVPYQSSVSFALYMCSTIF